MYIVYNILYSYIGYFFKLIFCIQSISYNTFFHNLNSYRNDKCNMVFQRSGILYMYVIIWLER